MPSKRTRFIRSYSHGEFGVLTQILPISSPRSDSSPVKGSKRQTLLAKHPREDRYRRVSLLSKEAESEKTKPDERFGTFLDTRALCKKKLARDFYMYGYLGAICSTSCWDDRIALDGFAEEISRESLAKKAIT